ncbi:MAG: hypothetical protein FWF51_11780 [Chitinivibrionia bacterium]|nr:hypothetical protein [Chitinivibrionia bacterium]
MKKAFILYLFIVCLSPITSYGQKVEFVKEYKYTASNDDSRNSAKAKAMEEAQSALLQELGVLVETRQKMTTTSSGVGVEQDFVEELKTYNMGKVKTTVVKGTENFAPNSNGDMVWSGTFNMVVDTADLYKHLDNILKQNEEERLNESQKKKNLEKLKEEIEELKELVETAKEKENEVFVSLITAEKALLELKEQKDIAQRQYDETLEAPNANTPEGAENTENAMNFLTEITDNYNAHEAEYRNIENSIPTARDEVNAAQNNLYEAELLLAKETGAAKPKKPKTVSLTATPKASSTTPKTSFAQTEQAKKTPAQTTTKTEQSTPKPQTNANETCKNCDKSEKDDKQIERQRLDADFNAAKGGWQSQSETKKDKKGKNKK